MRRDVIPGGSYGECFPDGSYVVLVGNDVVRTGGEVLTNPFGADYPQFLRAHPSGQVAGQGHVSGRVIRYQSGQWLAEGTTCGVNPVCFAPDGTLHVNDHCQLGTQGIRWIDQDGIHTGDATYDGRGGTGMAEWTRQGAIVVGQSYIDGCVIRAEGDQARTLEPGHCTFVRFNRQGSTLAVAMWKQQEHCAVLLWFDASEIASLPLERAAELPPPDPPPNPDPPEEPPVSTPNRFDVVQAQWAMQPAQPHSTESCGEFTRRVAWALNPTGDPNGWGLLSKTPGEGQYKGFAVDAIIFAPTQQVVDILGGAEGPNPQPGWMEVPKRESNHWTAPIRPDGGTPPPPPPPPPVDTALLQRVAALEAKLAEREQVDGWHDEHIDVLQRRVQALENRPAPALELPVDVVRESTHQVRTALRLSSPLTGTIVRKP